MCEQVTAPSIRRVSFILSASKSQEKPHQVNISPTCIDSNEEFIFDIRLISALRRLFWSWTSHWNLMSHLTLSEKVKIVGHWVLRFAWCDIFGGNALWILFRSCFTEWFSNVTFQLERVCQGNILPVSLLRRPIPKIVYLHHVYVQYMFKCIFKWVFLFHVTSYCTLLHFSWL